MIRKRRNPYKLKRLRQIVQIVFLMVFTFLLVKALFGRVLGNWVPLLIMILTTAILTLLLGRVWCGWVCPLGTILYWTRVRPAVPDPGIGAVGPYAPCARLDGKERGRERHGHYPRIGRQCGAESRRRPFLLPLSMSFGRGIGAVIENHPHAPHRACSL